MNFELVCWLWWIGASVIEAMDWNFFSSFFFLSLFRFRFRFQSGSVGAWYREIIEIK